MGIEFCFPESNRDGLVYPRATEWVDLINPVPSCSLHSEGLHNYSMDMAVGPQDNATPTVVSHDAEGLYLSSGSVSISRAVYHGLACSSGLDPVISFIIKFDNLFVGGADDEFAPEQAVAAYQSIAWGVSVDPSNLYAVSRGILADGTAYAPVRGDWYRLEMDNGPSTRFRLYHLSSGDPSDWDGGTLVKTYNRSRQIGTSGVLYPVFHNTIGGADRVRAVKIVPRRS